MQMKDLILEKISKELKSGIDTEAKTLYLLAEIRKVINLDGDYPLTLNIFCNWILHSELNHRNTIRHFLNKFESYIDYSVDDKTIARNITSNQSDFLKLNELKTDLREFLKKNNLLHELTDNPRYWFRFVDLLLEILKECQITFNGRNIRALSVVKDKNGFNCYSFHLRNGKVLKIKLKIKRKRSYNVIGSNTETST